MKGWLPNWHFFIAVVNWYNSRKANTPDIPKDWSDIFHDLMNLDIFMTRLTGQAKFFFYFIHLNIAVLSFSSLIQYMGHGALLA